MPDIQIPEIDLTTEAGARKGLVDIHRAAVALRDENGELRGRVERMAADLMLAQRTLSEVQNAAAMPGRVDAPEDEIGKYVILASESKSGRAEIRWTGEITRIGGEDCYEAGLLDDPNGSEWQTELQRLVEQRTIVRACVRSGRSPQTDRAIRRHLDRAPAALATIVKTFADASGVGASFIPDVLSPDFERDYMLARRVEALFGNWPMSSKNILVPYLTNGLRPYIKTAVSSDDPAQYTLSSIAEAQRSLTATGLAVRTQADEDASEDSVVAAMPFLRGEIIAALSDGVEDAICNGDTTATHQDTIASWNIAGRWGSTGLGGSGDHRRSWIGLRARAADVVNSTDQSGAMTSAGVLTAIGNLDSPLGLSGNGVNPQLVCLVSPLYFVKKMLGFAEVITVDKMGPKATVLTGQLASLFGVPLVPTEFVDNKLNASGVYDASTETKGGFALFNRSRFWMGTRRASAVEVEKDITRGVWNIVATRRCLFFTLDSSTRKNVHWSYNLTGIS